MSMHEEISEALRHEAPRVEDDLRPRWACECGCDYDFFGDWPDDADPSTFLSAPLRMPLRQKLFDLRPK